MVGSDGGATGIHNHSAIISQNELMLCCSDTVFKLIIPDLSLQWKTIADSVTCFGIYPHKDGYIVHGELEITYLNTYGQIVWQVGGRDIWTTIEGAADDFKIFDKYIIARDWGHNKYKIDFNGNITDYNENNI
ncbi:hypothetical protein HYN59_13005 [Flavobacterium album]|uniref:Uncharacterized protein n=1 Tax=Flavobacterium album TaxID=2175091 RepID=A0A2S1R323_9FLAO|nr:hypothetical protein HYN59_13005 [Flavobacterium album]